ncbi:MAG: ISLre2 family transposase [Agathobacter sp.]
MNKSITDFVADFINRMLNLQESFFKNPREIEKLIYGTSDELQKLGLNMIKAMLEEMNQALCRSSFRRDKWYIEKHDHKQLITSLGTIDFDKTLFSSKESRSEMTYLLDRILGFSEHQRMTADAMANVLEETVQTSYRRGGENINPTDTLSKAGVKDLIHDLKFPKGSKPPKNKKEVEYLYIDADEDHLHLQFQNKKGDLEINEKGRKKNGMIAKIIYTYEGVVPVAPRSKRHKLLNTHYFCRVTNDNEALWDEVYQYLDENYELSKVKKIYINSDGGGWIKAGMRRIANITYVLDEFHLSKYLLKMTGHMKDTQETARQELCEALNGGTKADFDEIVERLLLSVEKEHIEKRVLEAREYILNNWAAAKRRVKRRDGIFGCSAEGHVSHVLSSRMSSRPMGWSRKGAAKIVQLREWYYNKQSMLELAKYQQEIHALPIAAGAAAPATTAADIFAIERRYQTPAEREIAKYTTAISHTWTVRTQKQLAFYENHWLWNC